ncbi:unnamed protein product [Closterium sp. NIES-64]|nr:unnamed protein product [Closterium sp. NIES-64]
MEETESGFLVGREVGNAGGRETFAVLCCAAAVWCGGGGDPEVWAWEYRVAVLKREFGGRRSSPSSPSFPPSHSSSFPSSVPLHSLPNALSPLFRQRLSSPPPSPPSPQLHRASARSSPPLPTALPASAHAAPNSGARAEAQKGLGKVTGSGRGGSERSWVRGKGLEDDGSSGADSPGRRGESGGSDGAHGGRNLAQRGRAQANGGFDGAGDASDAAARRAMEGNGSLARTTGFRERADRTNEANGETLGAGGSGSAVRARKEWKAYEGVDRSQLRKRRKGKQIAEEAERGWGVGEESVDRVVERVMRLNFWDDVDGVLNRWSGRKNRKLFLPLIKAVSAHGDLRMALKVFGWMKAQRCYRAQPPFYSHLMHLAARSRKVNRARELFREMLEWRCKPDVHVYIALMSAHARMGDWQAAVHTFDSMLRDKNSQNQPLNITIPTMSLSPIFLLFPLLPPLVPSVLLFPPGPLPIHSLAHRGSLPLQSLPFPPICPPLSIHSPPLQSPSLRQPLPSSPPGALKSRGPQRADERVPPSREAYNALMNACGSTGQWQQALLMFDRMQADGVAPDIVSYNTLLTALKNGQQFRHALSFFLFSRLLLPRSPLALPLLRPSPSPPSIFLPIHPPFQVPPSREAYNALMNACGSTGQWQQALVMFDRMQADGVAPDIVSYNTLLTALKNGQQFRHALSLFSRLRAGSFPGARPDQISHNIALCCHVRLGEFDEVLGMFERMKGGVRSGAVWRPNLVTYNVVLHALAASGRHREAQALFDSMLAESGGEGGGAGGKAGAGGGGRAGGGGGGGRGGGGGAATGIQPNRVTYNTLLDAYAAWGMHREARAVFDSMRKAGIEPDVVSYSSLINAYSKAGRPDDGAAVLALMRRRFCSPNVVTFNALIDAFGRVGRLDEALAVKAEMEAAGLGVAGRVGGGVGAGNGGAGTGNGGVGVGGGVKGGVNEGVNGGAGMGVSVAPTAVTYSALIAACGRANRPEQAALLAAEAEAAGVQLNTTTYNALLWVAARAGDGAQVARIAERMVTAGVEWDEITFNVLVDYTGKEGRVGDAEGLFEEMQRRGMSATVEAASSLMDAYAKTWRTYPLWSACHRWDVLCAQFHYRFSRSRLPVLPALSALPALPALSVFPVQAQLECDVRPTSLPLTLLSQSPFPAFHAHSAPSLLSVCEQGMLAEAYVLLERMAALGCPPNVVTFTCLIQTAGRAGAPDDAEAIFERMRAGGVTPDAVAVAALLRALNLCERHARCLQVARMITAEAQRTQQQRQQRQQQQEGEEEEEEAGEGGGGGGVAPLGMEVFTEVVYNEMLVACNRGVEEWGEGGRDVASRGSSGGGGEGSSGEMSRSDSRVEADRLEVRAAGEMEERKRGEVARWRGEGSRFERDSRGDGTGGATRTAGTDETAGYDVLTKGGEGRAGGEEGGAAGGTGGGGGGGVGEGETRVRVVSMRTLNLVIDTLARAGMTAEAMQAGWHDRRSNAVAWDVLLVLDMMPLPLSPSLVPFLLVLVPFLLVLVPFLLVLVPFLLVLVPFLLVLVPFLLVLVPFLLVLVPFLLVLVPFLLVLVPFLLVLVPFLLVLVPFLLVLVPFLLVLVPFLLVLVPFLLVLVPFLLVLVPFLLVLVPFLLVLVPFLLVLVLQSIPTWGLHPSAHSYNLVLKPLSAAWKAGTCMQLLDHMLACGVPPNLLSFNLVLGSLLYHTTQSHRASGCHDLPHAPRAALPLRPAPRGPAAAEPPAASAPRFFLSSPPTCTIPPPECIRMP